MTRTHSTSTSSTSRMFSQAQVDELIGHWMNSIYASGLVFTSENGHEVLPMSRSQVSRRARALLHKCSVDTAKQAIDRDMKHLVGAWADSYRSGKATPGSLSAIGSGLNMISTDVKENAY